MKFPRDAPRQKVIRSFEILGFRIVRVGNHISTPQKVIRILERHGFICRKL